MVEIQRFAFKTLVPDPIMVKSAAQIQPIKNPPS
jgi:hypothetical protein